MEAWSLFGLSEHLERLSKTGDPLEVLEATVDFEAGPWGQKYPAIGQSWTPVFTLAD